MIHPIQVSDRQAGEMSLMMTELEALRKISAYVAENEIKSALEAKENMAIEAYALNKGGHMAIGPKTPYKPTLAKRNVDMQRLDCIYDSEPLGFEKDPKAPERIRPKDPLEEVDLGENGEKRPTYISANIDNELKSDVISILKEFRDCFAWDYNEMPGLNRDLVELKLPIKAGRKPVK